MNRLLIFISLILLSTSQFELIAQYSKFGLFIFFAYNLIRTNKISYKFKNGLLIWGVMILSVFTSEDQITSIVRFLYSSIVILSIIPLVILYQRNPEKSLNQFFYLTSIWLLLNFLMIFSPLGYDNLGLFKGVTYNANTLGGVLSLLYLPLCIFKLQKRKSIINWVLLFTTISIIFLTKSRSAALCVFFILVIMLTINLKDNFKIILFSLLITLSTVISNFTFISQEFIKYFVKYEFLNQSSLLATRLGSWGVRIEAISRKPFFGWGFGVNPVFIDKDLLQLYDVNVNPGNSEKGNSYLATIEEFGLIIGLFIIILLFVIIKRVYKSSNFKNPQSLIVIMVLLTGAIHASFESWMFYLGSYSSLWFWFFLFIGLTNIKKKYLNGNKI